MHRWPGYGFAVASFLSLTGCQPLATVPDLQPPLPSQWRNLSDSGIPQKDAAPAPDLVSWWRTFGDAQLDAQVAQVLANNLTIAQLRERLIAARALASSVGSGFRPIFHAGTLTAPDPDATTSYLQGDVDAQWELGLFGREQSTRWVAHAGVGAAAADLQSAKVTLIAETVRDYLALRMAQQQIVLLGQVVHAQRTRRDLIAVRRRLGMAALAELTRVDAETARANAALAEPRISAATSVQQLALLSGRPELQPELLVRASLPQLAAMPVASVPADLLRTRPDIQRAETQVLAAAGELGIARADLYPRLSLFGAITSATTTSGGKFGFGRAVLSVGPAVDIPLFDWGARQAQVTAKDAALSASVYAYRETVLEAVAEVENALASLQGQRARLDALQAVVAATDGLAASTTRNRRRGLADDIDVADATITSLQAQLELLDARQAGLLAYVALYKALGGAPIPEQVDR